MRFVLGLFLLSNISPARPLITEIDGLRVELLSAIFEAQAYCGSSLTQATSPTPFKVVVATKTSGNVNPFSRRNLGVNIIPKNEPEARLTKKVTYRLDETGRTLKDKLEKNGIAFDLDADSLTVEAGLNIYVRRTSGPRKNNGHVLYVDTFPLEDLAGVFIPDMVRELRLNPHEDILVLDRDLDDNPHPIHTRLHREANDNGSPGLRAIASALGMEKSRMPTRYPFSVIRFGNGSRETEASDDFLNSEGREPSDYGSYTIFQIQIWLNGLE